ncbi:MAG: hypothetical protein U0871_13340 [Gemmataceae bacterium]
MGKVTLDAATLAKLGGLVETVDVYDESGRLVGRCEPVRPAPFTDEEIEAAFRQTGPARPLEEFIREYEGRGP